MHTCISEPIKTSLFYFTVGKLHVLQRSKPRSNEDEINSWVMIWRTLKSVPTLVVSVPDVQQNIHPSLVKCIHRMLESHWLLKRNGPVQGMGTVVRAHPPAHRRRSVRDLWTFHLHVALPRHHNLQAHIDRQAGIKDQGKSNIDATSFSSHKVRDTPFLISSQ